MKRNLIAIVVYPLVWFAMILVSGGTLSLTGLTPESAGIPIVIAIAGLSFFVPAVISGWVAQDKSALIGGLGVVFNNLLIIVIAPFLGFTTAFAVFSLLPMALLGAFGGFIGGKLRHRY